MMKPCEGLKEGVMENVIFLFQVLVYMEICTFQEPQCSSDIFSCAINKKIALMCTRKIRY